MRKDVLAKALAFLLILSSDAYAQMQNQPTLRKFLPSRSPGWEASRPSPTRLRSASASAPRMEMRKTPFRATMRQRRRSSRSWTAAAIEKKDLKTSNFSVYPQYRTEGADKHQVVTYRASNTVTVTVRDLDKVGDILTKAVAAGSNQISGPNFSISEPEKYLSRSPKKSGGERHCESQRLCKRGWAEAWFHPLHGGGGRHRSCLCASSPLFRRPERRCRLRRERKAFRRAFSSS